MCLYQHKLIDSYFGLQSVAIIYVDVQIGPDLASGNPSIWLLCPSDMFPSFLSTSLLLAQHDITGSSCTFSFQSKNQSFYQRTLVPFNGQWYL